MKHPLVLVLASLEFIALATPALAQSGCTNSPENPTVVLAAVGSAGALLYNLRLRVKARRAQKLR